MQPTNVGVNHTGGARGPRGLSPELLAGFGLVLLFFLFLGARDLWNPNEPLYGLGAKEMAQRGDWLVPTINGNVYPEKPILYYWGALVASKLLGGVSEFSLRVPSALAAILSFWLVYALVLGYRDRRFALLTAGLFATQYMIFWTGRSVQMDILVVASTLAVLVPLTRSADHGFSPTAAWLLAGAGAGFGFLAKGPVAWVLPAIAFCGYALWTRRPRLFLNRHVFLGAAAAIGVAAPWFLMLWWQGQEDFLYNVLITQNFHRFTDAWDHQQPWWYYLKYLWIDLAPWSWFLPVAAVLGLRRRKDGETTDGLQPLSWIWIFGVVLFFSLSDSKRTPYILPIAPAVAILAAGVLDRFMNHRLGNGPRRAVLGLHGFFGGLLLLAGAGLWWQRGALPDLGWVVPFLATVLLVSGGTVLACLGFSRRRPGRLVGALIGAFLALYLAAAVCLPAANPLKSARSFSAQVNEVVGTEGPLRSYNFWFGRTGYSFYTDRIIPNIPGSPDGAGLREYWSAAEPTFLLVEERHVAAAAAVLGEPQLLLRHEVGGRTAYLLGKGEGEARPSHPVQLPAPVATALEPMLPKGLSDYRVFLHGAEGRLVYRIRWRTVGEEEARIQADGTILSRPSPPPTL